MTCVPSSAYGPPTDLVTGEAVVLELRLAKVATRTLALLIDLAVQLLLLTGLFLGVGGLATTGNDALAAAVGLVATVLVLLGYPVIFETLSRGRTLGKMALGLRVVRDDGGAIRFRHALVRGLFEVFVDVWLTSGVVGLVSSLLSTRGKRLGDVFAGTVVVRERVPVRGGPVAAMPPALQPWAATLDLARLGDDLALAVRQYLARVRELEPVVAADLGGRLSAEVARAVGQHPPAGVPPEPYLSAVLAERRARESARLGPPPGWQPPAYGPPGSYGPPAAPGPYPPTGPPPGWGPPPPAIPPPPASPPPPLSSAPAAAERPFAPPG